mgnify:FL=1
MADIDKAIDAADQAELKVENKDKSIEVSVPEDNEIDLSNFETQEDGTITFGSVLTPDIQEEFNDNLAEYLEDDELSSIYNDLVDAVENDKASRQNWENTYKEGLETLGMNYEERSQPFDGASGVMHPLLAESVTQFQAQAYKELIPSNGPVRTQVIGATTPDSDAQADRVREFMNYQLMTVMEEYDSETDQLLFYLPLSGSAFRKVYYDQNLNRAVSRFVPAEDLIVPYATTDIYSATRITHQIEMPMNDIRKLQKAGFYRDVEISTAAIISEDYSEVQDEIDELQGIEPSYGESDTCNVLEIHTELDLPGYEDMDAEGEPTGIKLPYVITLSSDSSEILAIRRNYRATDPNKKKINYFVHYKFLPGLGFYGFGLTHMIGGLSKASTSILRQLIDAGTLSNLPAGFKARGIRIRNDDQPLQPGEFRDMDAPGGNLRDAFVSLPYKEPSGTLLNLLGTLVDSGRRFAALADTQVGDANSNMPVGTTVALLERGTKVMSAIHKRLHSSQRFEFSLLAKVFAEYLPAEYPYMTANGDAMIKSMDFDNRVDVLPVSDPNIFSMSQRVMLAQEILTVVNSNPQIHGPQGIYEGYRRMYSAMGVQNVERLLPPPPQPMPTDPAGENSLMLNGQPVQAFPGQDHDAHINVHLSFAATSSVMANPVVMGAVQAHVYQHVSLRAAELVEMQNSQDPEYLQTIQMLQQMPPLEAQAMLQRLSEAVARDVAQVEAGLMVQVNQAFMPPMPPPDPLVALRDKELDIKAQDVERKREEFMMRQDFDAQRTMQQMELAKQKLNVTEEIARLKDDLGRDRLASSNRIKQAELLIKQRD